MVTATGLKVLICEDEYLLASDLSHQLRAMGAEVLDLKPRLRDLVDLLKRPDFAANAAVVDIKLFDQTSFSLVRSLKKLGVALAFCSGYSRRDVPNDLTSVPFFTKPADTGEIVSALRIS